MFGRRVRRRLSEEVPPAPQVPGFRAGGIRCGIKERGLDLALIASEGPARVAGVFTRSTVVGAPVVVSRERARRGRARAVIVNSGISNVGCGARGLRDARTMTRLVARELGVPEDEVLVASTGLIGEPLPLPRIREGVPKLVADLSEDGLARAGLAILTTDTRPKWGRVETRIGGRRVTVGGVAKGVGMIEPQMATMLAFLLTDAAVAAPVLRRLLRRASDASFNRVTVDGETSTSDMALLFANGRAGHPELRSDSGPDARRLAGALEELCLELAHAIVRDGEGATKFVTVEVRGARSAAQAERAARRIARSPLVKTALFGADPNWGRILQTLGAGRVEVALERAEVRLAGVVVFRRGVGTGPAALRRAAERMRERDVELLVELGAGRSRARVWTCDLSYDYVRINAEYHT